ncbi:hypothetical protein MMC10_010667 [Thelotrema lepadinum]|nr:hypothetical protein [Thelotrema lepadinum]
MPPPTSAALAAPLALLARQSVSSDVDGVKTTFSSWDNCMTKTYCKYPVIIAIVVGSLIALSIIFCIARCCCFGLECCCGICSCFNACCPSPRGGKSRSKYRDPEGPPPFQPSPYQGYHSQPPPIYNSQPQYAQFETGRGNRGGEDSLPAMPSWGNAASRKIEDPNAHEEMELGKIDPDQEQKAPMLANQAPAPHGGQGAYGAYNDTMPYQQHIANSGGDLGVAHDWQSSNYRGAQTTGPAVASGATFAGAGVGVAAAGRQTPNSGYKNSYENAHGPAATAPQQSYGVTPAYHQSSGSLPSALSAGQTQQGYQPFQPPHPASNGSWRDV